MATDQGLQVWKIVKQTGVTILYLILWFCFQNLIKMAMRKFQKESEDEHVNEKKVNGAAFLPDDILIDGSENVPKVDKFVFLPDDIISDILKRLPDAFLRYKAKYVCRRWFDIITNKILLDHLSFILHKSTGCRLTARLVDVREELQGLEVKEQYLDIPRKGKIESWCNELLLISDDTSGCTTCAFNLITKEISYLPYCPSCVDFECNCKMVLSFDGLTGVYKVLRVDMGPPMQCHILILKSDIVSGVSSKWKKIKVPGYMSQGMKQCWCHPVSVQGKYFYWSVHVPFRCHNYLVCMDMVKEKIFQLHLPRSSGECMIYICSFYEMCGFLAIIGRVNWHKPEIWILKDFQRMEWEKFRSVTFPDWHLTIYSFPSVIYKRYMICKDPISRNSMYIYDLKYGVVKELNINIEIRELCLVHTSSPSFI